VATLLAVIFFIVALALPWYGIAERGTYALPASNTTSEGDLISSFYWTGYVIYINPSTRSLSKIFIFVFHLFFSSLLSTTFSEAGLFFSLMATRAFL